MLSAGGQLDDAVLAEVAGLDRARPARRAARGGREPHRRARRRPLHAPPRAAARGGARRPAARRARRAAPRAGARARGAGPALGASAPRRSRTTTSPRATSRRRSRRRSAPGCAAMEVQAYREGAALFERALELWDRVPDAAELTGTDEVELLERAASCHFYADDLARSVTLPKRALALVDEAAEPRRAAWLHGLLQRVALGAAPRRTRRTPPLERGLALLADDGPSPERAGLLARQARVLMVQSRYHRAVERRPPGDRRAGASSTEPGGRHLDDIGALNALGVSLVGDRGDRGGRRRAAAGARRRDRARRTCTTSRPPRRTSATRCTTSAARPRRSRSPRRRATQLAAAADAPGLALARHRAVRVRRGRLGGGRGGARRGRSAGGFDRRQLRSSNSACATPSWRSAATSARRRARHLARAAELAVDSREPQYLGVLGALQAELATREGDVARGPRRGRLGARPDRVLLRRRAADGDGLGAPGLTAEATAAQHARDLGDERGGRRRARPRRAARRAGARVRRGRRAARGGVPRSTPRPTTAARSGPTRPSAGRRPPRAWDALGRPYPAAIARWRQAEALVAAGDREAAVEPAPARRSRRPSGSARRGSPASSRAWPRARGCG